MTHPSPDAPVPPPFRDRLDFRPEGAVFDGPRRYMMIRPEALMGIFTRLDPAAREAALEALAASIFVQGSDSARAYAAAGGPAADLPAIVAATAPDLGWGVWRFERNGDRLTLTVANSPFAAGFGRSDAPVCHAIRGMVAAVATLVLGAPASARETECAATGASACRFESSRDAANTATAHATRMDT